MSLGVGIGVILLATLAISRSVRGKKTPAPVTAVVFGLVVVALMVGAYAYTQGQDTSRARDRQEAADASASATQRAFDAQMSSFGGCVARVTTRNDIRAVLLAMVDLSDLFPSSPAAQQYTKTRSDLINAKYPALDLHDACGDKPTPPTTTGGKP